MDEKTITVDHPLWDELRRLNRTAAQLFPTKWDVGFGDLGLMLSRRPGNGGYFCTPTNSVEFAGTGGDGVHFSFIVEKNRITESSPVIVTIPMGYEGPSNFIGGASLFDFLCLGYHRGFSAMQEIPTDTFFEAYSSGDWQPLEEWHHSVYSVDEHQRKLLDFLIGALGLSPWTDLKRKFQSLQEMYMPLLEMPEET